jgi:drug/metabolite transporter (DMT)-like permease
MDRDAGSVANNSFRPEKRQSRRWSTGKLKAAAIQGHRRAATVGERAARPVSFRRPAYFAISFPSLPMILSGRAPIRTPVAGGQIREDRRALGTLYALLTAVAWAAAIIFMKLSGETIPPFAFNVFRIAVSSCALVLTLFMAGQELFYRAPTSDYLILCASGIIAIAISDTLLLMALNRLGAGILAIVDCLYSPFVVLFAFILLGEKLRGWQWVGMALVLAGVLIAARHEPPKGAPPRQVLAGVVYGLLAMATVAFGIVLAKPTLEHSPVLWATTIRQIGALAVMIPAALVLPSRRQIFGTFKPARSWRYAVPATLLGSYLALIFWIGGMKYSLAGPAAILNQTTSIYVLIFASMFLGERFTARKVVAAVLTLGGVLLVTSADPGRPARPVRSDAPGSGRMRLCMSAPPVAGAQDPRISHQRDAPGIHEHSGVAQNIEIHSVLHASASMRTPGSTTWGVDELSGAADLR